MNSISAITDTANTLSRTRSCIFLFWMARLSRFGAIWTARVKQSRDSRRKMRKHFGEWWPNLRHTAQRQEETQAEKGLTARPRFPKQECGGAASRCPATTWSAKFTKAITCAEPIWCAAILVLSPEEIRELETRRSHS